MFKDQKNTLLEFKDTIESLYPNQLTQEESFECEQNFFGFFKLLYQIDQRNKKSKENEKETTNNGSTN